MRRLGGWGDLEGVAGLEGRSCCCASGSPHRPAHHCHGWGRTWYFLKPKLLAYVFSPSLPHLWYFLPLCSIYSNKFSTFTKFFLICQQALWVDGLAICILSKPCSNLNIRKYYRCLFLLWKTYFIDPKFIHRIHCVLVFKFIFRSILSDCLCSSML